MLILVLLFEYNPKTWPGYDPAQVNVKFLICIFSFTA
jgi:hypothetical protein